MVRSVAPPSKLERYLINRLEGDVAECWLDSLELHAAEHLAQLFGSVALYGDKAALNLSDDEKYAAGDVGFDIVEDGPKGIPEFLNRMQSKFVRRDRTAGAASVYGRIYTRLTLLADPAFAAVHDIVSETTSCVLPGRPRRYDLPEASDDPSLPFRPYPLETVQMPRKSDREGPQAGRFAA